LIVGAELTLFSASNPMAPFSPKISKIDGLMPIVSETEEILHRGKSLLKDQQRDSVMDGWRVLAVCGKKFALIAACAQAHQPNSHVIRIRCDSWILSPQEPHP
jgi:hypothetical protein